MSQSAGLVAREESENVISGRRRLRLGLREQWSALQLNCHLLTAHNDG